MTSKCKRKTCNRCRKPCFGDIIATHGSHYHQRCFTCVVNGCLKDIKIEGFFHSESELYCRDHYQQNFGVKCFKCWCYVEGEAIVAMHKIFHQSCFCCGRCRKVFPRGLEICYDGDDFFCNTCRPPPPLPSPFTKKFVSVDTSLNTSTTTKKYTPIKPPRSNPMRSSLKPARKPAEASLESCSSETLNTDNISPKYHEERSSWNEKEHSDLSADYSTDQYNLVQPPQQQPYPPALEPSKDEVQDEEPFDDSDILAECHGCLRTIELGQLSIEAVQHQWHAECFVCTDCNVLLTDFFMEKRGGVYCEDDYRRKFGIRCVVCDEFISGRLLQVNESTYHTECAPCAGCGEEIEGDEDIYKIGHQVWHLQCRIAFEDVPLGDNDVL